MMATYDNTNSQPLPAAPLGGAAMQPPAPALHYQQQTPAQVQQQQQHHQQQAARRESQGSRPKSRTFSFRSDKSQKSGPVHQKLEPETHAEKQAKRLHGKADPTMAIVEAEPSAVAATEKTSLAPLRSIVHKDPYGNPIAEPDKSNPTRSRWERPLDTIRSFEAAIDGGYSRKSSYPNDSEPAPNFSRRNSYMTHNNGNTNSARFPQESYYGRPQSHLPTSNSAYDLRQGLHGRDSYYDQGGNPNNHGHNHNGGGYNAAAAGSGAGYGGQNGPRRPYSRIASEPQIHGHLTRPDQNIYPIPNNHRSYETVASGAGSGTSGEPAGYLTDPTSSDNSSIERRQSPPKLQLMSGQPMQLQQPPRVGFNGNGYTGPKQAVPPIQLSAPSAQYGSAPAPPTKNLLMRKPTTNQSTVSAAPSAATLKPAAPADKRKSWFSKRFSRQN